MTDSCERCGSPSPEALLRNIELRVDGSEVDSQTICPDCFADWIAHYQSEMAGDMPGTDGGDEKTPSDSALNAAVAAAQEQNGPGGNEEPPTDAAVDGVNGTGKTVVDEAGTDDAGGDEIKEVGTGGSPTATDDGEVEVDLGNGGSLEDDDEDDDGGLLLG